MLCPMRTSKRAILGVTTSAACLVLVACGSDASTSPTDATAGTVPVESAIVTTSIDPSTAATDAPTSTSSAAIVNTWTGPPVDLTALPIGTDRVSQTGADIGALYVCDAGNPAGGGAFAAGPWIDETAGTWDATQKIAVQGSITWPMASYSDTVDGDTRTINSNGLPLDDVTGTFPIASDDPAYTYDRNPNSIAESDITVTLPVTPAAADTPTCLPKGSIAVLENGVTLFAPIDALNRDAVAYETQDVCDGHPERDSTYHYHNVPVCILEATEGSSTVVGFAWDGFPIVVERDTDGHLPTNADLDECHGRISPITLDGVVVETYHYSATAEFQVSMGCYRGTPSSGDDPHFKSDWFVAGTIGP